MRFSLSCLLQHPCYHAIVFAGTVSDGSIIEIEDSLALKILEGNPPLEAMPEMASKFPNKIIPSTKQTLAVAFDQWPKWALFFYNRRQPKDKGVGDTAARLAGYFGGEQFKFWFKLMTGEECGCCERQDNWNERFPYVDQGVETN